MSESHVKASNPSSSARFGTSVALVGARAVVGAVAQSSGVPQSAGAAYVFARAPQAWVQEAILEPSNAQTFQGFGVAVSLAGPRIAVGSTWDSSVEPESGAAFVFDTSVGTEFCAAIGNSSGAPASIATWGSSSVGANDLVVVADGLPANVVGMFVYGDTALTTFPLLGDGFRCVGGQLCRLLLTSADTTGVMWAPTNLGTGGGPFPICDLVAGSTWHFQAWYRDPASLFSGFNTSNGVTVTFGQ